MNAMNTMIKPPLTPPKEGNNFPPEGGLRGAFSPFQGSGGMFWVRYFGLKAQHILAWGNALRNGMWGNALRYGITAETMRLRVKPAMTLVYGGRGRKN